MTESFHNSSLFQKKPDNIERLLIVATPWTWVCWVGTFSVLLFENDSNAVCCSVLQCGVVCCSSWWCVVCCSGADPQNGVSLQVIFRKRAVQLMANLRKET